MTPRRQTPTTPSTTSSPSLSRYLLRRSPLASSLDNTPPLAWQRSSTPACHGPRSTLLCHHKKIHRCTTQRQSTHNPQIKSTIASCQSSVSPTSAEPRKRYSELRPRASQQYLQNHIRQPVGSIIHTSSIPTSLHPRLPLPVICLFVLI